MKERRTNKMSGKFKKKNLSNKIFPILGSVVFFVNALNCPRTEQFQIEHTSYPIHA